MTQYSLKELRARHNLSQEKLARLVNVSTRTIINYEDDIVNLRKASYDTIEKLAKALKVDISEIFLG